MKLSRLYLAVTLGLSLSACLEASVPVETTDDALQGRSGPDRPDGTSSFFSAPDAQIQTDAGPTTQCAPGDRLGVCSFCSPQGAPAAPETDGQCPQIQCPDTSVLYERRQEGETIYCDRISPGAARVTPCSSLGVCATADEVCVGQREVVAQIMAGGCESMTGCQGTVGPDVAATNIGESCSLTSSPPIRYVRVRTREGNGTPAWVEIQVFGGPLGEPAVNLSTAAATNAQVASGTGSLVHDGDETTAWTAQNNRGEIPLDLGSGQRVSEVRLLNDQAEGNGMVHELYVGNTDGQFRLVKVFRGPMAARGTRRFSEGGICRDDGRCEGIPICENYLYQQRGFVCDVQTQNGNYVCQLFVPQDPDNGGRRKTCNAVCQAHGLTCVNAAADEDDSCRSSGNKGCGESMKDFLCTCIVP